MSNKRLETGKESLATEGASPININEEMDGVEVRWMFRPELTGPHKATMEAQPGIFREIAGHHVYMVIVRSQKFPHSKLVGEITPHDVSSVAKLKQAVGILAGSVTEELNERLGDNVDPDVIARNAVEALMEMLADQKRAILQQTH